MSIELVVVNLVLVLLVLFGKNWVLFFYESYKFYKIQNRTKHQLNELVKSATPLLDKWEAEMNALKKKNDLLNEDFNKIISKGKLTPEQSKGLIERKNRIILDMQLISMQSGFVKFKLSKQSDEIIAFYNAAVDRYSAAAKRYRGLTLDLKKGEMMIK